MNKSHIAQYGYALACIVAIIGIVLLGIKYQATGMPEIDAQIGIFFFLCATLGAWGFAYLALLEIMEFEKIKRSETNGNLV
jgi:hypothetical protein